jgi:hypothetical protein
VANENDVPPGCCDCAPCHGHVIRDRNGGILNDDDIEAVLLQDDIDRLPAGAVDEAAVDENN